MRVERQRLHGMGEALHAAATAKHYDMPLRVYAPVGGHEDLLPYLVRRLLENGANTSFVNAFLDERRAARDGGRRPDRGAEGAAAARTRASQSRATSCCRSGAAPPASTSASPPSAAR